VREKRVGILKPQGSLERAREERALASTQDDQVRYSKHNLTRVFSNNNIIKKL
jgi:hypothetical protein